MKNYQGPRDFFKKQKLRIAVLTTFVVLGIALRCLHIDNIYAHDEVYTSFRINGYLSGQVAKEIEGNTLSAQQIKHFQSNDGTTWQNAFNAFATRPEHPPLFFVLERFWTSIIGDSIIALRSLPVVFGIVSIPIVYWFCLELFGVSRMALVAVALMAVSPFHVFYSQYARAYSLWILLTLCSSIATVRFLKKDSKLNFSFLLLTTILSLYTHILSGTVLLAQCIYAAWYEKFKATKKLKLFLSQAFVGGIVLLGWFIICSIVHSENLVDSIKTVENVMGGFTMNRLRIFQFLGLHFSGLFIKLTRIVGFPYEIYLLVLILVLGIIFCSYLIFLKTQPLEKVLLILLIFGVSAIPIVLSDLLDSGIASRNARYFCPAILMTSIVVAYSINFAQKSQTEWFQVTGDVILSAFLFFGVVSCFSRDDVNFSHVPHVTKYLNSQESPIVYAGKIVNLIAVADKSESDTSFVFLRDSIEDIDSNEFLLEGRYIFEPNPKMEKYFEDNKELKLSPVLGNRAYLFRVEKQDI